jgi:hypothetical protein
VDVGVWVINGVFVLVGVPVIVGVRVGVRVPPVEVLVTVGVAVGVSVPPVGVCVGVAVSVGVAVTVGVGALQPWSQVALPLNRKPHMNGACRQKAAHVSKVTGSMQMGSGAMTQP